MSHASISIPQVPATAPARLSAARTSRAKEQAHKRRDRVLGRAVLAVLVCAIIGSAALPTLGRGSIPDETVSVRIATGETLWEIAARTGGGDVPTAELVAHIREINGLGSAQVEAGTVLLVPAGETISQLAAR